MSATMETRPARPKGYVRAPKLFLDQFKAIKSRVNDLYQHMGDKIRSNATIKCWMGIFPEMSWMVGEVERLAEAGVPGENPAKFAKIKKFVARVTHEQADGIKSGQFGWIGANIIGSMRYLVRAIEAEYVRFMDDAEGMELLDDRLVPEDTNAINLDLDEGIGDDEPPA